MKPLPDDCTVRLVDLPISVGGRISEGPDGHVDIYINARHAHDGRLRDLNHELEHWENDDLHNGLDIRTVEGRHAKKLPPLIRARDLISAPRPLALRSSGRASVPPPPKPVPRPAPDLSARQLAALARCFADLDAAFLKPTYDCY